MPAKKQTPVSNVLKFIQSSQKIKRKGTQQEREKQEDAEAELGEEADYEDPAGIYDDAGDEDLDLRDDLLEPDEVEEEIYADDLDHGLDPMGNPVDDMDEEMDEDALDDMSDDSQENEDVDEGDCLKDEIEDHYIENMEKSEDFYEYLTFPQQFINMSIEERIHLLHEQNASGFSTPSHAVQIYTFTDSLEQDLPCVQTLNLMPINKRKAASNTTINNLSKKEPKRKKTNPIKKSKNRVAKLTDANTS